MNTVFHKYSSPRALGGLLALLLLGSAGIASAQVSDSTKGAVRDAWLDGKLESALLFNTHLNSFDIHTDVKGGVAYLTGFVESDIDRDLAGAIAESIEGVDSVQNELKIDPDEAMAAETSDDPEEMERRSFKQTVSDLTLAARVKTKLLTDENTEGTAINVDVSNGVVILNGSVASDEEKQLAGRLASNVPGAGDVRNYLTVESKS